MGFSPGLWLVLHWVIAGGLILGEKAAKLASIGTAGIPGSGLVMLTIVLNAVNLPLEIIGLLAGIDRILNMARVIPNIVGDAAAAMVIAKSEGELQPVTANQN